jgi:hypothetical protein
MMVGLSVAVITPPQADILPSGVAAGTSVRVEACFNEDVSSTPTIDNAVTAARDNGDEDLDFRGEARGAAIRGFVMVIGSYLQAKF